jgi:hypothetical protein
MKRIFLLFIGTALFYVVSYTPVMAQGASHTLTIESYYKVNGDMPMNSLRYGKRTITRC